MNSEITLTQAQQKVDEWIKTYGVRYFNELTNMAILTEEVGEVARIIARTYGEQSSKETDLNKQLPDELADVLFVLIKPVSICRMLLKGIWKRNRVGILLGIWIIRSFKKRLVVSGE